MLTYTVVQRHMAGKVKTNAGYIYEVVRDCGHKHRDLATAIKCKKGLRGELGYFGQIEDQDGVQVDLEDIRKIEHSMEVA